ncbi:class I SAM-dependent methyltransferase [bacterium]|nr:class I SAM-dependent methyltransferase [bacterium]
MLFTATFSEFYEQFKTSLSDGTFAKLTFAKTITPEVNFTCGDITDPKLFDQPFDVITLIETLEHIPPEFIPQFVKGLHQHLKNDGYLLLTVPSINHKPVEKHYQHFDHTLIGKNLKPYFEITEHFYINKNCFWNKWLKKMIKNDFFVLNHQTTLNWLYRLYSKNWLSACPRTGKRVCVFAKKQALS